MSGILEDKEIGRLWRRELDRAKFGHPGFISDAMLLIRKLVEERAQAIAKKQIVNMWQAVAQAQAEFGIDPETWK